MSMWGQIRRTFDPRTARGRSAIATAVGTGQASMLPNMQYQLSRNAGMTEGEAATSALTGGMTHEKGMKAAQGRQAASDARAREQARQQKIRTDIDRIRATYGEGMSPEAQANRQRLEAWQRSLAQASAGEGQFAAANDYARSIAQLRAQLSRSGQLGGSIDAQTRAGLLSQFAQRQAQAQAGGQASAEQLRQDLLRQRLGLESQIRGAAIDPNALAEARNRLWVYQNQPSAAEIAGGRLAAQGAQAFSDYRAN